MSTKFSASQIRDLLKTRAHCLQAGFPITHPLMGALNKLIGEYIARVGLATYLSEMLGPVAMVSMDKCTLYDHTDRPLELDLKNYQQPLQHFIKEKFLLDNLPSKVEVKKDSPGQREVRYL
ncbi:MAG: hypothetical protein BroJett011_22940 [Chloroflexota bacterium]|nr:MAG: hypothetical protein BroJett011_22940 [Chloroflexota bacterium]